MQKILLLILTILLFSNCSKNDDHTKRADLISEDNFDIKKISLDFSIVDMDFLDKNVGYAIDYQNRILITRDSGNNWNELYVTNYELLDIQFINLEEGFILAKNGEDFILLNTSNGGVTFQERIIQNGGELTKLYFVNSELGFALGNHIVKTKNSGASWNEINLEFNVYRDMIKIDNTIYTSGLRGTFLKSEDDGDNWEKINLETDSHIYEIKPFQNLFYLRGQSLLKTDLKNTQEFSIPGLINKTHIYNENVVIGFGEQYPEQGYFQSGAMFISNNSGKTWITTIFNDFNRITVTDFIDANYGFAIADDFIREKQYLLKISIE